MIVAEKTRRRSRSVGGRLSSCRPIKMPAADLIAPALTYRSAGVVNPRVELKLIEPSDESVKMGIAFARNAKIRDRRPPELCFAR